MYFASKSSGKFSDELYIFILKVPSISVCVCAYSSSVISFCIVPSSSSYSFSTSLYTVTSEMYSPFTFSVSIFPVIYVLSSANCTIFRYLVSSVPSAATSLIMTVSVPVPVRFFITLDIPFCESILSSVISVEAETVVTVTVVSISSLSIIIV